MSEDSVNEREAPRAPPPRHHGVLAHVRAGAACPRPLAARALAVALPFVLLALAAPADAQPRPWRMDFDFSFSSIRGNQNMSLLNSSVRVRHARPALANFDVKLQGRYGVATVDEERQRQEFYQGDFKMDLVGGDLGRGLGPYVETRIRHDPAKSMTLMVNTGAGGRYEVRRADGQGQATMRVALLHSFEDRLNRDPTQRARWNMELEGRQTVTEEVALTHSTKFQPLHSHMAEYMLSMDTRLNVRLTDRLSLLFRHQFERDTDPPARRPNPDDTIITAGVSIQL